MKANKLSTVGAITVILLGGSLFGSRFAGIAQAQVGFSMDMQVNSPAYFYTPLATYGTWMDLSPYGRCWRPANVPPDWRPYEIGHWEWTDVGWYWVSDEPWAWATYHYGGWEFDPNYGWVWVPGTEWAPAWVVWREAPDYVGWAPCGPGGAALSDSYFMFVDVHHFHDRLSPREFVFNDRRIFRRSRPVGGFRRESRDFDGFRRQIAINRGPDVAPIQRATGTRFTQRSVNELVRRTRAPETVRRQENRRENEHSTVTAQQPAPSRRQQRLYQEAPATSKPSPTGRNESRLYREAPATQNPSIPRTAPEVPRRQVSPEPTPSAPRAVPSPRIETPRRQPLPETTVPTVPGERRTAPGVERIRPEHQVPRPQEIPPRAVPAPVPHQPVAPPQPPGHEKHRDREGD